MTREPASPAKRSVAIAGHPTSISLEREFWEALAGIARERGLSISTLIAEIDAERGGGGLSSAVRVHILRHYRRRAEAAAAAPRRADRRPDAPFS